jgi:hypothetical protein
VAVDAAPKDEAEAVSMTFTRPSSAFSRRDRRRSSTSFGDRSGREPRLTFDCRTHLRTLTIASHRDAYLC